MAHSVVGTCSASAAAQRRTCQQLQVCAVRVQLQGELQQSSFLRFFAHRACLLVQIVYKVFLLLQAMMVPSAA